MTKLIENCKELAKTRNTRLLIGNDILTVYCTDYQFGIEENNSFFKPRNLLSKQRDVTKPQDILIASFPIFLFPEVYPVISEKMTPGSQTRHVG
jgi:hypothetical protein